MKYETLEKTIGHTPTVLVETINGNELYLKLEGCNIGGSVKDRVALEIINEFERKGLLHKDSRLVEATSGNTGIGLALIAAIKGLSLTIIMPENMSKERISLMEAYGAKVILSPKEEGMLGAENRAKAMENEGYLFCDQFGNEANVEAHVKGTGPEIVADFPEGIDYFFAGVGTSGTLSGCSRVLKKAFKNIKIIAVEPYESPVLEGKEARPHGIQGIGANFVPPLYEASLVDEISRIKSEDAILEASRLAKKGFFIGISSAAAYLAMKEKAKSVKGKKMVGIAPDGGIKYMSMGIYGK